ncbi:methyltransferase [Actinomadura sp. CNU-125]|uniref:methyltransferase n=1 Tax=Actinomadura sp. CNU-125 TaxID=1904961 RepID=UPI0009672C0D|nr:methyltransferase [Actinomadura sp. CNU-125]OLT19129.1 methyltransferase [Actinomadura sp. CNU-125]
MTGSGDVTLREADYLRLLSFGTTAFELLHTGLELELFERVEEADGLDVPGAAAALGIEEQPARILLLGLTSLSLLEKRDSRYVNTEMTRRRLLRSGTRYLGSFVRLQGRVMNAGLTDLGESLRRNTNVGLRSLSGTGTTLYERLSGHPELQEVFYTNMGEVSAAVFDNVLNGYDFTKVRHVIDLGGGDGTSALELARRFPDLHVTVYDHASLERIVRERVAGTGVEDRVHFHPGDLFHDPLPSGADAIMYFHIFEIWSLERNAALLRKCRDALTDGGVCLVYNFVSDAPAPGRCARGSCRRTSSAWPPARA